MFRRFLLSIAAAASLACGDSGTSPSETVAGTYALVTINGKPLPYTFADTVGTVISTVTYLQPFSIGIKSDNTARFISTVRFTSAGTTQTISDTTSATYTLFNNLLSFRTSDGGTLSGGWNGSDQITISEPPDLLVFRKQ